MTNACIVGIRTLRAGVYRVPVYEIRCKKDLQWFNEANCCQISLTTKELLFGIIPSSKETKIISKFNYMTLSRSMRLRHYAYFQTKSIIRTFNILVPRGRAPFGQHQESRPLAKSNSGSPRFTDFLSL